MVLMYENVFLVLGVALSKRTGNPTWKENLKGHWTQPHLEHHPSAVLTNEMVAMYAVSSLLLLLPWLRQRKECRTIEDS